MRRAVMGGLLLSLLCSAQASAYVRTVTARGNPISWWESCVFLVPGTDVPAYLTVGDFVLELQASSDTWSRVPGSYLQLIVEFPQEGLQQAFHETGGNENAVVFVEQGWPHAPDAAALTTITYLVYQEPALDGRIVDTDVEMNAVNFDFGVGVEEGDHDLQNIFTHELGHVIGLDHTCDDGMVEPTPVDHEGNTIPSCYPLRQLSDTITEATMFNFAYPAELDKRTLEPDDQAGISAIYPESQDPGLCAPPDLPAPHDCGCASTGSGAPPLLGFLLLLIGLWIYRTSL